MGPFLILAEFEPMTFRQQVCEMTRPLMRARWYSPGRWRLVNAVRDHLSEIVEQGGITAPAMRAALLGELRAQFSEPQDVHDVLDDYDLRQTEGKRPLVGVLGRFLLLGRFHYLDQQIMLRALQPLFAPDKLAHALGRTLVTDAYDLLDEDALHQFEFYAGRASRIQAFKWGMPQAALFGTPMVTAIRQQGSPVTLTWIGDATRPTLTRFMAHASTQFIGRWHDQQEQQERR